MENQTQTPAQSDTHNGPFTREKLEKLHTISAEFLAQRELASELLRTAQDRFKHRAIKVMREGQEVELTEKVLWDEVFLMGLGCEAGQKLREVHPEVFEAFEKQDKMAEEMKVYTIREFGINFTQMSISDYLKMSEGLFKLMIEEYGLTKK